MRRNGVHVVAAIVLFAVVGIGPLGTPAQAAPSQWTKNKVGKVDSGWLTQVSCVSSTFCVAVGITTTGTQQPLIEMYDGTHWSIKRKVHHYGVLNSVSCVSATFCVAVGERVGSTQDSIVYIWNGRRWTFTPVPDRPNENASQLKSVSCVSASSCIAVGSSYTPPRATSLVESWDGAAWSIVASPNQGPDDSVLSAVSCVSATSCVAVGSASDDGATYSNPLAETYDGSTWSVVAPQPAAVFSALSGVSCVSTTLCMATGVSSTSNDDAVPLAEVWDGATWSVTTTVAARDTSQLGSVSCTSASNCVSVGGYFSGPGRNGNFKTLIEAWNGVGWSRTPSPDSRDVYTFLDGISCVSDTSCLAVGHTASDRTFAISGQ